MPFSRWVTDQLRRHAARSTRSFTDQLVADAALVRARGTNGRGCNGGWRADGAICAVVVRGGVYWIDLGQASALCSSCPATTFSMSTSGKPMLCR